MTPVHIPLKKRWRFLTKQPTRLVFAPFDLARYALTGALSCNHHHLLVACMPKSGSTFLSAALANLPGFQGIGLTPGYGRREQELDTLSMLFYHRTNYVAQQHVRYSGSMEVWRQSLGIKPIVLVRDIFDVIPSLRDHFRREDTVGPMGYVTQEMVGWEDSKLDYFIATMLIPWYFNFYRSWLDCENMLMVRYEDINADPASVVGRIVDHYGLGFSRETIESAVNKAQGGLTRKNQAIVGRGQNLSEEVKARIYEMADFYPGVDFSPIGIIRWPD